MISDFFTSEFILLVPWIKSNTLIVAPIYSIDMFPLLLSQMVGQ